MLTTVTHDSFCSGVSNFYQGHLAALKEVYPEESPYANQIFIDIMHQETDFVTYMQAEGIKVKKHLLSNVFSYTVT